MPKPHRASDPGLTIHDLREPAWVVCPRCAGPARSFRDGARFRLTCPCCAAVADKTVPGSAETIGDGTDGRFHLPLYLATNVRGHRLWVYNPAHLDALAAWLGASLRERSVSGAARWSLRNRTMMARLPRWMSSASARPHILKALAALRDRAVDERLVRGPD